THMKRPSSTGPEELELYLAISSIFPEAIKYKTNKVYIEGKSHIKGFEIDILIRSLGKGIEFDGTYYHSLKGLKRSRPHWPDEDIHSYHEIKDKYFLTTHGIQILHIKEEDWKNNKSSCIYQIEQF